MICPIHSYLLLLNLFVLVDILLPFWTQQALANVLLNLINLIVIGVLFSYFFFVLIPILVLVVLVYGMSVRAILGFKR